VVLVAVISLTHPPKTQFMLFTNQTVDTYTGLAAEWKLRSASYHMVDEDRLCSEGLQAALGTGARRRLEGRRLFRNMLLRYVLSYQYLPDKRLLRTYDLLVE
jgi:hypothetical protein